MADFPQHDRPAGLSGGSDVWDNDVAGEILWQDYASVASGAVALSASDTATGAPTGGSPAIGQVHNAVAVGVATGPPVGASQDLSQIHSLGGSGVSSATINVGSPVVAQAHALVGGNISAGSPDIADVELVYSAGVDIEASELSTGSPSVGSPDLIPQFPRAGSGIWIAVYPDGNRPARNQELGARGIVVGRAHCGRPEIKEKLHPSRVKIGLDAGSISLSAIVMQQPPLLRQAHRLMPRTRPDDLDEILRLIDMMDMAA